MNQLHDMDNDQIAAALERLTKPAHVEGQTEPTLYKKALEGETRSFKFNALMKKPIGKIGIAAALVLCAGLSMTMWRVSKRYGGSVESEQAWRADAAEASTAAQVGIASTTEATKSAKAAAESNSKLTEGFAEYRDADREKWKDRDDSVGLYSLKKDGRIATDSVQVIGQQGSRQVVHKAVMELQAPDVRATYMKAILLVSDAGGEFVQDSALAGGDPPTGGNATLRVAAHRLPTVLQQLRELGKVTSENSNGEDVTDRLVDLAARLRNEERIEKELLDLLEHRKDSQLKDVLDVRDRLGQVRGTIEQLKAQQAAAEKSVALATILVVIRAAPEAPKPPPKESSFMDRLEKEANDGLRRAGDSAIWVAGNAVAGIPWWIGFTLAGIGIVQLRRRAIKNASKEPAPAI